MKLEDVFETKDIVIENEKSNNKTIKTVYSPKYKSGKIFSPLTNKYLEVIPEEVVKEKFDYEIPISDIKKAGITTTGAVGDNQLPELLEVFSKYRKDNQLWETKQ